MTANYQEGERPRRCRSCGFIIATPNPRGPEQKFCSDDCRATFHRTLHHWAELQLVTGRKSLKEMRADIKREIHLLPR